MSEETAPKPKRVPNLPLLEPIEISPRTGKPKLRYPQTKMHGVGTGGNPATAEALAKATEEKKIRAYRRKMRFLGTLKKAAEASLRTPGKVRKFPDYWKIAHTMHVPFDTLQDWRRDPQFQSMMDEIEAFYIDQCVRIVYDAAEVDPWLARDILRSRDKKNWGQTNIQNAHFTQINILSEVPRPDRAQIQAENAELIQDSSQFEEEQNGEALDSSIVNPLDSGPQSTEIDDAQVTESAGNDAFLRENTSVHAENSAESIDEVHRTPEEEELRKIRMANLRHQ